MATVVFRGSRDAARKIALQLGVVLSGRSQADQDIARGFATAIGFAALTDIKDAFLTKARGGTDEMGIKWEPLKPATIANRGEGPGNSRVIVTAAAIERERVRKEETDKALERYALSNLSDAEALRRARIVGGLAATKITGQTKTQTLGSRDVDILRDTGILFNSLTPGTLTFSGGLPDYSPPEDQVFRVEVGEVTVGTNVPYASAHQNGNPAGNLPARPFLPDDTHPVPDVWFERWLAIANTALAIAARKKFEQGK